LSVTMELKKPVKSKTKERKAENCKVSLRELEG
jgi:hypothetical protein